MQPNQVVWVWLLAVGLAGCVASQMGEPPRRLAATDTLLTAGDIQVAQEHLRAFGFDPRPVQGVFTAQTQATVEAYQARYGLPVTGLLDEATRRQVLPGFNRIRR
jgi:peptidoglycan hydrolase-like protein with peptidoglycan-binding domain